jgi:hypothetical protein
VSKNVARKLSQFELSYLEELALYDKVLTFTGLISLYQHGIQTNGRGIRAVKIFTRQTLTAISLNRLLPRPTSTRPSEEDLWDLCSIASLTRNIIEGYLSLNYFGIENITESEAELRFFLLQLHKNIEWYNLRKNEMETSELKQFEEGIEEEKNRIKNHSYLSKLSNDQRKRAIQGREMYKTKFDFETELPICKDLIKHYRHLSNLVHPLPLSIERTDNLRGRGIGSEPDISYCLICLMLARRYLAATVTGIVDLFPNELGIKFKKELESIRPLENEGFDL